MMLTFTRPVDGLMLATAWPTINLSGHGLGQNEQKRKGLKMRPIKINLETVTAEVTRIISLRENLTPRKRQRGYHCKWMGDVGTDKRNRYNEKRRFKRKMKWFILIEQVKK